MLGDIASDGGDEETTTRKACRGGEDFPQQNGGLLPRTNRASRFLLYGGKRGGFSSVRALKSMIIIALD